MNRGKAGRPPGAGKLLIAGSVALVATLAAAVLYLRFSLPTPDCFIGSSVTLVDSHSAGGRDYHLYRIVTGFADKVETLVLFAGAVEFDACGNPNIEPAHAAYLDHGPEEGAWERWINHVIVTEDGVDIEYAAVRSDDWTVEWRIGREP